MYFKSSREVYTHEHLYFASHLTRQLKTDKAKKKGYCTTYQQNYQDAVGVISVQLKKNYFMVVESAGLSFPKTCPLIILKTIQV